MIHRLPKLPESWMETLGGLAERLLGAPKGALAEEVARVSDIYNRRREGFAGLRADPEALRARLLFFLPRDLVKILGPLMELAATSALPRVRRWRVLDVGSGLGATTLGTAWFAHDAGRASGLDVDALDTDGRALSLMREVCASARDLPSVPIDLRTHRVDLERLDDRMLQPRYDLILVGMTLNELWCSSVEDEAIARRSTLLERLARRLTPDGALVVLEPALRPTSRALQQVRDTFDAREGAPYVYAPCVRRGSCPLLENARDWCHEELPYTLPIELAQLARRAGLRATQLTYSYLTLRPRPGDLGGDRAPEPRYRVVGGPLRSKGKLELWLCGERGKSKLMRLDRHASDCNRELQRLARGSVVRIEPAPGAEAAGLLRVGAHTRLDVLQRWD